MTTWQPELDDLEHRKTLARQMGGADKVARQHAGGRLTVRERIDALLDPASFIEVGAISGRAAYDADGALTGFQPANCVFGRGLIEGRPVVVVGDDFTVRGGSADATIKTKPLMAEQMASEFRLPILRVIEGSGGGGSVKTIETTGRANLPGGVGTALAYQFTTDNLGLGPVVALGLGSVAGLGAARLAASHYSLMTKTSAMFVAGPPVVARLAGGPGIAEPGKQELGGWETQTRSGAVDDAVDDEAAAFAQARRFLSYLPSSVHALPPELAPEPLPEAEERARAARLMTAIPRETRRVYRMRPIIEAVADPGSVFEMGRHFGRSIITALARIDGLPVAFMAGDPYVYGGSWTADACAKIVRFIDLAETFHLPVVHLVDCPGFMIGLEAERAATIRHGVRAMTAINQSSVPWCSVVVRNAFEVAGAAHQPAGRLALRYAWPSARWGSLPLEGGIEAAYRAEIEAAEDGEAKLREIEARLQRLRSPMRTAETFWVEEIIPPSATRAMLQDFARLARPLLMPGTRHFAMRP